MSQEYLGRTPTCHLRKTASTLSRRNFKNMSFNESSTSIASITNLTSSSYQNWLETFYSSRLNEVIKFTDTSHVVYQPTNSADTTIDDIIEPCLLDCRTEHGYIMASIHLILHAIREKQAKSPTAMATLGLSGGTSPREIFRILGQLNDHEIDLKRLIIFLVDERYVPRDDEMSNARLVENTVLKHWQVPKENIIFPDTSLPIEECVKKYEEDLEAIFGKMEVCACGNSSSNPSDHASCPNHLSYQHGPDIITLGIGDDFHIAGLFPEYLQYLDASYVTDCEHRVMITYTETAVVNERITLSLPFLNCAKRKLFFIRGERKKRIWNTMVQYRHVDAIKFPATMLFTKPGCVAVLDSSTIRKVRKKVPLEPTDFLTFILFGSSGDLSRRKLYPALFHLFYLGFLPNNFCILAVSRTPGSFEDFFKRVADDIFASINTNIFLRDPAVRFDFPAVIAEFKTKLSRVSFDFDAPETKEIFNRTLLDVEGSSAVSHRLIYLATPAEAYHPIMKMATAVCRPKTGWFRVMLEKPFGRDLDSCIEIERVLSNYVNRDEIYLVDHYLGKPVISFIVAAKKSMRYQHYFNRKYIKSVHICLKETIGSFGRSYFDKYGIIRDMIQNHGMQLLSLVAMNKPDKQRGSIVVEKANVLKYVRQVTLDDVVVGQYVASADGTQCAYVDEPGIPKDSRCITYCTMVLYIDNEAWHGVPFVITAGKGLDERLCQVKMYMRDANYDIDNLCPRALTFRIQPNPSVFWTGDYATEQLVGTAETQLVSCTSDVDDTDVQGLKVEERILRDIDYSLTRRPVVGCYEILFYHAFGGRDDYFASMQEVKEAWRILTPVLHQLDDASSHPLPYQRGSAGPEAASRILAKL